jgi:hypothetical protein
LKPKVAGALRSQPSIHAAPSLATATRSFLTVDNIASHLALTRGNAGKLSDPYLRR